MTAERTKNGQKKCAQDFLNHQLFNGLRTELKFSAAVLRLRDFLANLPHETDGAHPALLVWKNGKLSTAKRNCVCGLC